jgi:hypothetical protein
MTCHFMAVRMAIVEKNNNESVGDMWKNWNPHTLLARTLNGAAALEVLAVLKKLNIELTHDTATPC